MSEVILFKQKTKKQKRKKERKKRKKEKKKKKLQSWAGEKNDIKNEKFTYIYEYGQSC